MNIMEIKDVGYAYESKRKVLKGVNAQMEQGKLYAILGPSGCGKTTLLSLIGGLDSPDSGQILFDGRDIAKTGLADHRKNHVSFIFQAYNLIDYLALQSEETYHIRVEQFKNFGTYTLKIGPKKAVTDITSYTTISDSIEYTDQENDYSFIANTSGTYRFEFTGIREGTYVRLKIFNSGWEVIKSDYNLDNNDGLTVSLTSGETYYVRVQQNKNFGNYTLNIGSQKPNIDITNYTIVSDSIQYTDQKNDYSFKAEAGGTYRFEFSGIHEGTYFRLRIFNSGWEPIKSESNLDNNDGLTVTLTSGEIYYVRVQQNSNFGDYTLNIGLKKTTRDITNYIGVSDSIQYTDQENDYIFTANISGMYSFQFSGVPSGTGFRLRIFNAGGEQIKTDYDMDNDDSLTVSLSKGETYCIRVVQYKGIGDYSLSVARASN